MAVQLTISYETLRNLVLQLPPQEAQQLAAEIRTQFGDGMPLSPAERAAHLRSAVIHGDVTVSDTYSDRREDWYDDDGR